MLSKKQINNISILSLSIALLATIIAPPVASTVFVFASTAAISAVALSFMTAISNIMPNNIFNNQSNHTNSNNNTEWTFFRSPRRPVIVPVVPGYVPVIAGTKSHVSDVHVTHRKPVPKTVGKKVHILNPVSTATGTPIPVNATNIQRVITTKDGVSRQIEKSTTSQQPVVTSMGTPIPVNASNIKRTITPILRDRSSRSGKASPAENHIGKNVIITNSRSYTPQASHRTVQRDHDRHLPVSHDVPVGNKLSDKVIIRTRRA